LQVGAPLDAGELRVGDCRQDHPEERLADPGHASDEQVARIHLPVLFLVVGRRDLGEQHDVGEGLRGFVADQGLAAFGQHGVVEGDGFGEVWVHV
jgi:hypothetical protein